MNNNLIPYDSTAELAELLELHEAAVEYIQHSRSENTTRAYQSDWAHFEDWAIGRNLETHWR